MRQWGQMRQMRHFFICFGIRMLGWQKVWSLLKIEKSVAFCHTFGSGLLGAEPPWERGRPAGSRFPLARERVGKGRADVFSCLCDSSVGILERAADLQIRSRATSLRRRSTTDIIRRKVTNALRRGVDAGEGSGPGIPSLT